MENGQDLPSFLAENIRTFILDIDSTIYPEQIGLHPRIKDYIAADANRKDELAGLRQEWTEKGFIRDGRVLANQLTHIYPFLVHYYRLRGPEALTQYFDAVYNVDYSVLSPQPELVSAVRTLRDRGCRFAIFTNGPWRGTDGRPLHAQIVLSRLGFPDDAFVEDDVVDIMKTDRRPELLDLFGFPPSRAGDVFKKPDPDAFGRVLKTLRIDPAQGDTAFFDDNADAVNAAAPFGIARVHVLSNNLQIDDAAAWKKRDFAVWCDRPESEPYPLGLLLRHTANVL